MRPVLGPATRVLLLLVGVLSAEAFHARPTKLRTAGRTSAWRSAGLATMAATGSSYDLELFSPAKINLFLRIIRRREDGYHELASLFQTVGFGDTLRFKKLDGSASSDEFASTFESLQTDNSNLVLRALDLFRSKTGVKDHFKVFLDKRIPVQAGLGGGSSNAATTLYAANQLTGRPASEAQLIEWSAELGSDITFFLSRGTAYCTGRGEIIEPLPALPAATPVTIVKPALGLSTPAVFKALDLNKLSPRDPRALLDVFTQRLAAGQQVEAVDFVNDLEPPAFSVVPELKGIKDRLLDAGFPCVMMSGSGTSIFAMGQPTGPLPADFADRFAKDNGVSVWQTAFTARPGLDESTWYPDPYTVGQPGSTKQSASAQ